MNRSWAMRRDRVMRWVWAAAGIASLSVYGFASDAGKHPGWILVMGIVFLVGAAHLDVRYHLWWMARVVDRVARLEEAIAAMQGEGRGREPE